MTIANLRNETAAPMVSKETKEQRGPQVNEGEMKNWSVKMQILVFSFDSPKISLIGWVEREIYESWWLVNGVSFQTGRATSAGGGRRVFVPLQQIEPLQKKYSR